MANPLLETKLYAPRVQPGAVPRRRLSERLRRAADSRLTLVSAPAGFGKTTLLAELASTLGVGASVAWLSLDAGDNDPTVFWTYVITALDRATPGLSADARSMLEASDRSVEAVLPTLLNDLAAAPHEVVLVLDDYHVIDATGITDAMAFLIERLPPNVHMVIGTRADPGIPLARLRAKGELVEIRAADLRFSPDEATAYFNGTMGLSLTDTEVAALEGRTEGWIAALQLAGLSMQGREDIPKFIAGFAGDDRYVVDYLAEEVLLRQPDHVRAFLLETSILARMTGPLCDAVTGRAGGSAALEALERGNLFLVPLDDRRRWYRYHHLFADVLQARLLDEQADLVPVLHLRASDWYGQNDEPAEAIRHALAAKDFERAADLIELAIPETRRRRQEARRRHWLEALPDEVIRRRPVLCNAVAGTLLIRGEVDGVDGWLREAERGLDDSPGSMIVVDQQLFRELPAWIAIHRAGLARLQGDVAGTIAHADRALELVQDDDHGGHGGAAALRGLALWNGGDLDAAYRGYADAMASFEKAGFLSDMVGCAIVLADVRVTQGRLREAMRAYERGLEIATAQHRPPIRGAADMHVGMSLVLSEQNDLAAAELHLSRSDELGEENGLPKNAGRSRVAAARIREATGDLDGAVELLLEAERRYVGDFHPDVRPIAAMKARVRIVQCKLPEAWTWAREAGISVTDEPDYLHEFEHTVLARLLLAQAVSDGDVNGISETAAFTERLLVAAESGGRYGSAIEILVVRALALHALDDVAGALAALGQAIVLAEPEGFVRVFLDEGRPMTALLRLAAKHHDAPEYVGRLMAAGGGVPDRRVGRQQLVEPLSDRELEVLRYLQSDLTGPEIARELSVSLNTLRTHTKNIYAKLGSTSRRAAVRRASELELLARP